MEEVADLIMDYGVSIVIIIMFLYDWFTTKQDTKNTLKAIEENSKTVSSCITEIKQSNENTSKSLDLLQKSMDSQTTKIDKLLEKSK